jgi:hypothetical protein
MTAWAMVAGVDNLDWHGWGYRFGLPLEVCGGPMGWRPSPELSKVLKTVRNGGKISMKELEKKTAKLKYIEANTALDILGMQGDMNLKTQEFSPNSLASYVENTAWRSRLPDLKLLTTHYYQRMAACQHEHLDDGA